MTFDDQGPLPAAADNGNAEEDGAFPLPVTILVCSSCRDASGSDARPRPGEKLAEQARRHLAGTDVRVVEVECLGNCKRRLSAALVCDGAWSYVFGDLAIDNGADLVTGARLLQVSQDGLLPWRGRPDCLKRGLVSRIPSLASLKVDQ